MSQGGYIEKEVYMKKICSSDVTGSHDGTEYDRMWRRKHRYYRSTGRTRQRKQQRQKLRKRSEEAKESEATAESSEDYSGTVVVYSPHDADPLNAGCEPVHGEVSKC